MKESVGKLIKKALTVVYITLRAILADLRLFTPDMPRWMIEQSLPGLARGVIFQGMSFTDAEVLGPGWARAVVDGRRALIYFSFGLGCSVISVRKANQGMDRYGEPEMIMQAYAVPPRKYVLTNRIVVPTNEE